MATEGTPTSPASDKAAALPPVLPGPLALLTATVLGSYLGARVGRKPLALAAGAGMLAWLKSQYRPSHPSVAPQVPVAQQPVQISAPVLPPSAPVAADAPAVDPLIQEWLTRQLEREKRAEDAESLRLPLVEPAPELQAKEPLVAAPALFPPAPAADAVADVAQMAPVDDDDDDYRPEPLLLDGPASSSTWEAESFAALTEPVPAPAQASAPADFSSWEAESFAALTEPVVPVPAIAAPAPPLASTAVTSAGAPAPSFEAFVLNEAPAQVMPLPPPPPASALFLTPPPVQLPPAFAAEPLAQPEDQRPVFTSFRAPPPPFFAPPAAEVPPIPGIEPLPSWHESGPQGTQAPVNDLDLEELFNSPAFLGSPVPQDILSDQTAEIPMPPPPPEVPPTAEYLPPGPLPAVAGNPMAEFFKVPMPAAGVAAVPETAPPASSSSLAPEIAVHVAAAGEAWFDPPLADVVNPWLPPKVEVDDPVFAPPFTAQPPSEPASPFPSASSVQPPSQPLVNVVEAEVVLRPRAPVQASVIPKNIPSVKPPLIDQESEAPSPKEEPPPEPPEPPREKRARSSWRSWWRGD